MGTKATKASQNNPCNTYISLLSDLGFPIVLKMQFNEAFQVLSIENKYLKYSGAEGCLLKSGPDLLYIKQTSFTLD